MHSITGHCTVYTMIDFGEIKP